MKKIILILAIVFISCTQPEVRVNTAPTVIPDDPYIPPVIVTNPIKLALYADESLKFYDGESIKSAYTGKMCYAGNRIVAIEDILYQLDEYGNKISENYLIDTPDVILISGSDTYLFVRIPPEDANALGGGYKAYTHIYKNNTEFAPWYTYQFYTEKAYMTDSNKIILVNNLGALKNITDSVTPFKISNDYYIENVNTTARTATMNGKSVSYSDNYFNTAKWQKVNDTFYSNYGHTFSDTDGLKENQTILKSYMVNPMSLHVAYNSYWFDSTTGKLYKYIIEIDRLDEVGQIFIGSNDYATGNTLAPNVNPLWIDGMMYYHDSGSIKTYNPITGNINIFSTDQEIWEW